MGLIFLMLKLHLQETCINMYVYTYTHAYIHVCKDIINLVIESNIIFIYVLSFSDNRIYMSARLN